MKLNNPLATQIAVRYHTWRVCPLTTNFERLGDLLVAAREELGGHMALMGFLTTHLPNQWDDLRLILGHASLRHHFKYTQPLIASATDGNQTT